MNESFKKLLGKNSVEYIKKSKLKKAYLMFCFTNIFIKEKYSETKIY